MRCLVLVVILALIGGCSKRVDKLELVEAPATSQPGVLIAQQRARAEEDGKRLLVYVGAGWCEPCRRFHDAAAAGQLDQEFGNVRLLVFDADRDMQLLARIGYVSNLIPLFAIPNPNGSASGLQIEGSIKGAGAVDQIAPRLRQLLDQPGATARR